MNQNDVSGAKNLGCVHQARRQADRAADRYRADGCATSDHGNPSSNVPGAFVFYSTLGRVRLKLAPQPLETWTFRLTCCRHYPGAAAGRSPRSSHPAVTAFPDNVVRSACTSSFSRIAQRSLALRPAHSRGHLYVTSYTEGFSHFVTSMTAPVASGWSGCRVRLAPTGKRRQNSARSPAFRARYRPPVSVRKIP